MVQMLSVIQPAQQFSSLIQPESITETTICNLETVNHNITDLQSKIKWFASS